MTALFAAELLKLRTTRTFAVLVGCAVGLALLIPGLVAIFADDITTDSQADLLRTDLLTGVFILTLAIVGMAGEWRHRTIAGALLAAPDRLRFFAAKVGAYAAAGALIALAVTLVTYFLLLVILPTRGYEVLAFGDLGDLLWRNLVIAAYYGALGVGIAALVRNQAGAIVTALVILFVIEPTILGFWPEEGRFLPFLGAPSGFAGEGDDEDLLSAGVALLVMLGWVAVICGGAAALFRRRDIV